MTTIRSPTFCRYIAIVWCCFHLLLHFESVRGDEGWLPDRLGISYEFKIHIDAGKEECFYQDIQEHTTLYVAFQVIRGGDGKAGFGVRNPQGTVLLPYEWKESAEYEEQLVNLPGK